MYITIVLRTIAWREYWFWRWWIRDGSTHHPLRVTFLPFLSFHSKSCQLNRPLNFSFNFLEIVTVTHPSRTLFYNPFDTISRREGRETTFFCILHPLLRSPIIRQPQKLQSRASLSFSLSLSNHLSSSPFQLHCAIYNDEGKKKPMLVYASLSPAIPSASRCRRRSTENLYLLQRKLVASCKYWSHKCRFV